MKKLHALILGLLLAFTGVFGAQATGHIPDYIGLYKAAQARNDKAAMDAIRQDMPKALYSARENGLWGYINILGEWVIAPKWVFAGDFRNGVAMVSETSWTEEPGDGIIDTNGDYLVPPKYLMVESQSGHYYGGKDTGHIIIAEWIDNGFGLTGYFDVSQHFYAKPQWVDVSLYDCGAGLLGVQDADSGKWGYVEKSTGIMKLPPTWDNAFAAIFNNGWAFMQKYDEQTNTTTYSLVNESGETLILPEGISFCDDTFFDGLILIKEDATGLFGYANTAGTLVIQAQYTDANPFKDGKATVYHKDAWWLIDTSGTLLEVLKDESEAISTDDMYDMEEGLQWFESATHSDRYGLMDRNGRVIFEPVLELNDFAYDDNSFSEGLQPVGLQGKWGYINVSGAFVIAPVYDAAYHFDNGLGYIRLDGRMGYLDRYGHLVYFEQLDDNIGSQD